MPESGNPSLAQRQIQPLSYRPIFYTHPSAPVVAHKIINCSPLGRKPAKPNPPAR